MFNRLRSDIQFIIASRCYRKREIDKARLHLDKCLKHAKNHDAVALALDATLMVHEGRRESARARFEEARSKDSLRRPEDREYLENYCKYYECLLGRERPCDQYLKRALECGASKHMRSWLLLSDVVERDGLQRLKRTVKVSLAPAYEAQFAESGWELAETQPVGPREIQLVFERRVDRATPPHSKLTF